MVRSIQISSLKILDPNRHNLGESDRALAAVLGLEDVVVEPLLAVGDDPGEVGVRAVTRIPESGSPRTSRRWPWQVDSSLKLGSGGHYLSKSYPKYSKVQEKEQVFLNQVQV